MHSIEIEKLIIARLLTWQYFDKSRTARPNVNFKPPTTGFFIRPTVLGGINFMSFLSRLCGGEVLCLKGVVMSSFLSRLCGGEGRRD